MPHLILSRRILSRHHRTSLIYPSKPEGRSGTQLNSTQLRKLNRSFFLFIPFFFLLFFLFFPKSAYAAIVSFTGWESGDRIETPSVSGTWSVQQTTKRTGDYALRTNPTETLTGYHALRGLAADGSSTFYNTPIAYHTGYFRYAIKPTSNDEIIFRSVTSAIALKFELRINSSGNLAAYDSAASLLATGSTVLAADTWYRLDIKVGTGASAAWEVKIDGTVEISGTGDLTLVNNGRFEVGKVVSRNGNAVDFFYDDWVIDDAAYATTPQVIRMDANADGFYTAWTGDYTAVDEVPHDSGTTVISTATNLAAETVGLETAANAGVVGNVASVKSGAIAAEATPLYLGLPSAAP